jgi:hypothetical protein
MALGCPAVRSGGWQVLVFERSGRQTGIYVSGDVSAAAGGHPDPPRVPRSCQCVCLLGGRVTCVCAMTFALVVGLVFDTPIAWRSAAQ